MAAEEKKTNKHKKLSTALRVLCTIAVMLVCLRFFSKYVLARTVVDGNSMYPTLHNGDNLMIYNMTKSFDRYDIVVFNSDINGEEYLIKRIIGLPGENIKIDKEGTVYINDRPLVSDIYGADTIQDPGLADYDSGGVTLGEDQYFCMGDNRNRSEDSRFAPVGSISTDDIVGKVVLRIWPFEAFGNVDIYRERKNIYSVSGQGSSFD